MPPGYFALIFMLMFWPFSLFYWRVVDLVIAQWSKPEIRFLAVWMLSIWLFFECIPTKLPEYVLPAYPAIAALVALAIEQKDRFGSKRILVRIDQLHAILWFGLTLALAVLPVILALRFSIHLNLSTALLSLTFLVSSLSNLYFYLSRALSKAVLSMIFSSILAYFLVFQFYLPNLTSLWLTPAIAQSIQQNPVALQSLKKQPLWAFDFCEPSLVFYLGTHSVLCQGDDPFQNHSFKNGQLVLLTTEHLADLDRLSIPYTVLSTYSGINYNRGQNLNLTLVRIHAK